MAEVKIERMNADAFLAWEPGDEGKYELVDGTPRLMTGARRRHDQIVVNGLTTLRALLRGAPCRPYTDDLAVKIPGGNVRRPDLTVDCGEDRPDDLAASSPIAVIEVLSPSNNYDMFRKLIEYKSIPTLAYIILIEPDQISATFYQRSGEGTWDEAVLIGSETIIRMPHLGIDLPLGTFYEDVL